jgi:DNA-binding protein HU-beta
LEVIVFFCKIATKLIIQTLNNKEFISELSAKLGYTNKDISQLTSSVIGIMTQELQEGNIISIHGFGTFEVKKKLERISVNPATQQRMLVPPKLVLSYKPSSLLKEKFK